ncbi:hypothetical protein [Mongoliibacter ruber]|uniref:Uncharacterized protein n=1 Tax=Mongoliibacter ruber TaxID=1750599 RepID=A0A2T0WVN7_9BACT|nr:hypothetical protein [Mongoliibacter ruber]PRY90739.1 hypothetical protein CLW00_101404 [Mongoliibacter ruber]
MLENLPKKDIFKTPEGYFETLPEKILERKKGQAKTIYMIAAKYAAAAAVVFGLIYFFIPSEKTENSLYQSVQMENEIELYIDSDHWQAEDILAFIDNPDDLLDQMIEQEWSSYEYFEDETDDELWY